MPVGASSGFSYVAGLLIVSGSNATTSAKYPFARQPRFEILNRRAGLAVILCTASSSVSQARLRLISPSNTGNVPYNRGCGRPVTLLIHTEFNTASSWSGNMMRTREPWPITWQATGCKVRNWCASGAPGSYYNRCGFMPSCGTGSDRAEKRRAGCGAGLLCPGTRLNEVYRWPVSQKLLWRSSNDWTTSSYTRDKRFFDAAPRWSFVRGGTADTSNSGSSVLVSSALPKL